LTLSILPTSEAALCHGLLGAVHSRSGVHCCPTLSAIVHVSENRSIR